MAKSVLDDAMYHSKQSVNQGCSKSNALLISHALSQARKTDTEKYWEMSSAFCYWAFLLWINTITSITGTTIHARTRLLLHSWHPPLPIWISRPVTSLTTPYTQRENTHIVGFSIPYSSFHAGFWKTECTKETTPLPFRGLPWHH